MINNIESMSKPQLIEAFGIQQAEHVKMVAEIERFQKQTREMNQGIIEINESLDYYKNLSNSLKEESDRRLSEWNKSKEEIEQLKAERDDFAVTLAVKAFKEGVKVKMPESERLESYSMIDLVQHELHRSAEHVALNLLKQLRQQAEGKL